MIDDSIFEKSPFETDEEYIERVQDLEEELIVAEEYGYELDPDDMDEDDGWDDF